ncbi:MAG: hypothetical protein ACFFAY_10115 [Promethearchaeota archaeon]
MEVEIQTAINKAIALCNEENATQAESLLQSLIHKYPENVELLTAYGKVQSYLDLECEAEATFRTALAIDSDYEDAVCALGRLLDQSLRSEEAELLLRDLLTRQPGSHCAMDDLCRILLTEDKMDEALELADSHTRLFSKDIDAYSASRYVLARLEDMLRFDNEGPDLDEQTTEKLLASLNMQFELILRMEKEIGEDGLRDADLLCDIHEDLVRLTGEMEYLLPLTRGISSSRIDEILKRTNGLIAIGVERRANPPS